MADYELIDSDSAAIALAELLDGNDRARPTAVVTIAAGQDAPYIDVQQVAQELGGLADVYLIATGPHTWTFSHHMGEGTQVYGGAGRVYPVGHEWVQDLSKSPLRFAWGHSEGPKTTKRLIEDGLDMAAAAGLLGRSVPSTRSQRREGTVKRADNERAWVDFGGGGFDMGTVPPQLAEPDLPIERVLRPGMKVSGILDLDSRWFDIRASRLAPADALADYQIGDVVLAEVEEVSGETALVRLLPGVSVRLNRIDVTPEEADLRTLLTPGEVIAARVLGKTPWWLTLLGVDEKPRPAASIYPGGPPWLVQTDDVAADHDEIDALSAALAPPVVAPAASAVAADGQEDHSARNTDISPAQMPGARGPITPAPAAAPSTPGPAVRDLSLKVTQLHSQVRALESQLAPLRDELLATRYERDQLAALKNAAERRADRFESELKKSRSALRKAAGAQATGAPAFADPERGFRYLVETAWARRIPVGEQLARALPEFVIGERFLASVGNLEGITAEKVADVAMELITGLAESSSGRDMHRLRVGSGGDDPVRQRDDGAVCWRLALQVNTPSARRLHAWRLPNGLWELSSVRKHDDFEP